MPPARPTPPGPSRPGGAGPAIAAARIGGGIAVLIPIVRHQLVHHLQPGRPVQQRPGRHDPRPGRGDPAPPWRRLNTVPRPEPAAGRAVLELAGPGRSTATSAGPTSPRFRCPQSIAQRLPVDLSIAVARRHPGGHHRRHGAGRSRPSGAAAGSTAASPRSCSAASRRCPAFVVGIILVVLFAVAVAPAARQRLRRAEHQRIWPWLEHIILPSLALSPAGRGRHRAPAAHLAGRGARAELHRRRPGPRPALPAHPAPARAAQRRPARRSPSSATTSRSCWPGAVAAEAVFSLPGLGQLLLDSAQTRDIPVVQGVLLVVSCFVDRGQPGRERRCSTGSTGRTTGSAHDAAESDPASPITAQVGAAAAVRAGSPSPCCSAIAILTRVRVHAGPAEPAHGQRQRAVPGAQRAAPGSAPTTSAATSRAG